MLPDFIHRRGNPYSILRHCAFYEVSGQEVSVLASPDRSRRGSRWFQVDESREAQWYALLTLTARERDLPDGLLVVNTSDIPLPGPILNFCRPKGSDFWLIPNFRFGYEDLPVGLPAVDRGSKWWKDVRKELRSAAKNHDVLARPRSAFLNGLVNSIPRIDYLQGAVLHPEKLAASMYIGGVHGKMMLSQYPEVEVSASRLGYLSHQPTPFIEHLDHAICVYADGNTLSDRMRLLLSTGSAVVAYESAFEEFYSDALSKSGAVNFVESFQEILDLVSLAKNDTWLEEMSGRAEVFCDRHLTLGDILDATAWTISEYLHEARRSRYSRILSNASRLVRTPFQMRTYEHKDLPDDLLGP